MTDWSLRDIEHPDDAMVERLGDTLWRSMKNLPKSYSDRKEAVDESRRFRDEDRFAIAAMRGETVAGWIGAIRHTSSMWELHPLCVDPEFQGSGLGRALVEALEMKAAQAGVGGIWLGTEDETGATNLFGVDLFPDPLEKLEHLELLDRHPIAFYAKLGYTVCGALPDASGPGMHDFLMAKRISANAARGAMDGD